MVFIQLQMDISDMYGFTIKTETLWKIAETCTSVLRKLKLNDNEEKVSALLKLYRNLAETFQHPLEALLSFLLARKKLFPEQPNLVIGLGKRKGKGDKYDTVLYTDGKQFSR